MDLGDLTTDEQRAARDPALWALEGVRSLPFDFAGFLDTQGGDLLSLRSLGHDPALELTLVHQRRLVAFAWGFALLVVAWGMQRTRLSGVRRLTWLIVGFVLVSAIPVVAPWNHEIGTIADHVLVALLVVTAWYVAVGVVRLAGLAGRWRPAPAKPGVATALLLAAGMAWASFSVTAVAQEANEGDPRNPPGPPVAVPADAVIIPYDHEDPAGTAKARRMLVPYDKYVELWNLAYPDQKLSTQRPVAPFAWAGAEYSATLVTGDDVLFTGKLRLSVFQDDPIDVPLTLAGAVFTSAKVDGQPAQIRIVQPQPRPPAQAAQTKPAPAAAIVALTVSGKGEKSVELTIRMKQTSRGGLRLLQGQIPAAPATALHLIVPDAKSEVAVGNGVETLRFETKQANEPIETALHAHGVVSLTWRPKVSMGEVDRSLTSQSDAEIDVREDGVRVTWRMTLEFRGGQRDGFTFLLPAGYLLERVVGDNVRGWQTRADDASSRVDVALLKPATDREQATLVLSRRGAIGFGAAGKLPLPTVTAEGAALQQGVLTLRRSPLLDVRVAEARGLSRAEIPGESVSESSHVAELSPLGLRTVEALRFQTGSYAAQLEIAPVPGDVSAEVRSLLKVDQRQANYESLITLRSPDRPLHRVRLDLPAGLELDQVAAPGPVEWSVGGAGAQRELTLLLGVGQRGEFQVTVRGRLPRLAGQQFPIPRLVVRDVAKQEGDLVVQVDPSVDVRPEQLQGCEPVLLNRTYGWLNESQRPLARLALHHRTDAYSGQLKLAPRQPRVTVVTVTNVRVTGRSIAETVMLEMRIEEAGIREVVFTLPAALRTARISAPLLRQKRIEPLANGDGEARVRVRLELQDEVMGQFRVLIEQDRLLTADRQEAPLPVVETGRTDQRFVTIESTARDELVVEKPEGLEPITRQQQAWARLAAILGDNILEAYQVKADTAQPRLAFRTQSRSAIETVGARIALSETDLVVDGNGAYRGKQTYHVDNGTEQFLVVELPPGAELWTALVAGEPVRPQQLPDATTTSQVRIPLVKTAAGDLDYPVVLTYGGKVPAFGAWSRVRFPFLKTTNINVELSRVRLRLPQTHRWLQFGGSLGRVEERAEYEASWLNYQTRRFQRLLDTLASGESDALTRMRSQNNLKQLGLAVEKYRTEDLSRSNANPEFNRNYSALNSALEQSQQKVEQEATVQLELSRQLSVDNRDRLNEFFAQQDNQRASNVATQLGSNFMYVQPGPAKVASGTADGAGRFDVQWFDANGLQSTAPMNRVILNDAVANQSQPGKADAAQPQSAEQVEALRGELGKRLSVQAGEQAAPQDRLRRGGKKQVADEEVRQRYQQQLEAQVNSPNDAPASNTPALTPPTSAPKNAERESESRKWNVPRDSRYSNRGVTSNSGVAGGAQSHGRPGAEGPLGDALQKAGGLADADDPFEYNAAGSAIQGQAFLTSLDVDLPEGGVEYLFRTPRGDLEIQAYSLSAPLLERGIRLAIVLVVAFLIVVPFTRLSRRWKAA